MTITKLNSLSLAVALFMAVALNGCGQKGDLYLPDRLHEQPTTIGH